MNISSFQLAALAVAAIDGLEAVGTRGPYVRTPDFQFGGVLDSRGRHWVVKYPLNTVAATTLEAEIALAPALRSALQSNRLPFDVMRPGGFAQVPTGRVLVYQAPMGRPRPFEELTASGAHELGRTLAAIHNLPQHILEASGHAVYSADQSRQRLLTELHDIDATHPIPAVLRRRWEEALEEAAQWQFATRVVHGDVTAENFLWSEGAVSCVLGFGQAQVGDPAQDFAELIAVLPEELFDAVLTSYQNALQGTVDENLISRALLLSELALMQWLSYGVRTDNGEIIAQAREMLDELAADISADPELDTGVAWQLEEDTYYAPADAELVTETELMVSSDSPVAEVATPSAPSVSSTSSASAVSSSSPASSGSPVSGVSPLTGETPETAESAD
ncbi:MAG: phosphotransferase [Trueperella sp.]|nr:phosphotransferase [Trueperella sp.]